MKSFHLIVQRLEDAGRKTRKTGAQQIVSQCPAHDDNKPSMAVTWRDGKTLINCFAGCDTNLILQTLDLTAADLFDEPVTPTNTVIDMNKYLLERQAPNIDQHPAATPSTTQEWIYVDENNDPRYKTVKTFDEHGKKQFRQYRYDPVIDAWIPGLNGQTPPLYDLVTLTACIKTGIPIVICEGEKDVDSITKLNPEVFATTAPMGAGKWRDQHTQQLDGANLIYIIHDNDEPGINHAITIKEALTKPGRDIRILTPRQGKDATDHINHGYGWTDFIDADKAMQNHIAERQQARIEHLTQQEIEQQTARNNARRIINEQDAATKYQLPAYTQTLTDELQLPDEPINYVIDQLWPTGANISLTATYKAGKTSTLHNCVKALADHLNLFEHFTTHHTGRILLMNYEVNANQERTWLREVGIRNTNNITLLNMRGHKWTYTSDYVIEQTIKLLQDNNIQTWVLDPLARAFVGSGDENSNQDVGIFLDTLDYIKQQAGVANLIIAAHTGRNAEQGNSRARGASRFDDWADARWMLSKDKDGQRWFEADGRDVNIPESRLDWNEQTRTQIIHIGVGKQATKLENEDQRVYDIIDAAGATGIIRQRIIDTYKAAYKEESLSKESADSGILGRLQNKGLIRKTKLGNAWVFTITNNQLSTDE